MADNAITYRDRMKTWGDLPHTRQQTQPVNDRHMLIDLGFYDLPDFLPVRRNVPPGFPNLRNGIDTSNHHQSKLGLILHELSHVMLGVDDQANVQGITAYGTQLAAALAAAVPARAEDNAENWAILIEALGHHNSD